MTPQEEESKKKKIYKVGCLFSSSSANMKQSLNLDCEFLSIQAVRHASSLYPSLFKWLFKNWLPSGISVAEGVGQPFTKTNVFWKLRNSLEPQTLRFEMLLHLWQNSITKRVFDHQWDAKVTIGLQYIMQVREWLLIFKLPGLMTELS